MNIIKEFDLDIPDENRIVKRVYDGKKLYKKIGTLYIRDILPELLKKDGIRIFWGPEHCLPKPVYGIKYVVTIHDLAFIRYSWTTSVYNQCMQRLICKKSCETADFGKHEKRCGRIISY